MNKKRGSPSLTLTAIVGRLGRNDGAVAVGFGARGAGYEGGIGRQTDSTGARLVSALIRYS